MLMKEPVLRRSAAAIFALFALVCAGGASAKIFTTSASVQDFRFDDQDLVLYTNPSLDQVTLELTADNQVVLTSIDGAEYSTEAGGEVLGTLNLGGSSNGAGYSGSYMIFGSLPSGETSSFGKLMTGTLDAMQSAPDGLSLAFLFLDGPATGSLGTHYQSVGIFARVAGLDEEDWIRQYNSSASIMNLIAEPAPGQELVRPAAPIPATPLLLLAGLFGLRFVRRRA